MPFFKNSSSPSSTTNLGTPSKGKTGVGRTRSFTNATNNNGQTITASASRAFRFIMIGFGVGAATTALFHSVTLPTIRVELEYDYADAPVLQKTTKSITLLQNNNKQRRKVVHSNPIPDDDATDKEEEDEVEKEREEIAQELPEEEAKELLQGQTVTKKKKKNKDQLTLIQQPFQPDASDPDFSNPGPPPKLLPNEAFAACILIKDDNHWLIEWLAYHYHVMPLRYLIVAIDPDSKTSPIPILKRWKDRKMMTISIWDDSMFMPTKINANPKMFDGNVDLMKHRVRQNNFYFKCMKTFKQRNREWLMLIDTDEYIVTNYASGLYFNITKQIPISQPGNVLKFIKQYHDLTGENHTCSYMPRYMFGNKEMAPKELLNRHIPEDSGLDGSDFLTQRFVYRNPRRMHNGKNLINIQKLPAIKTYTSVHHVSSYCPDPDKMRTVNHVKKALVRVHHYLGTEEQYLFRSDPREAKPKNTTVTDDSDKDNTTATGTGGTNNATNSTKPKAIAFFTRGKGRYDSLNARSNYPDQGARAWIKGFIKDVGLETAKELLKDCGKVGVE